jgi:hypothetical protein
LFSIIRGGGAFKPAKDRFFWEITARDIRPRNGRLLEGLEGYWKPPTPLGFQAVKHDKSAFFSLFCSTSEALEGYMEIFSQEKN